MSIKIIVDNNYFANYEALPPTKKEKIKKAFLEKKFHFYLTTELVHELLGLYRTNKGLLCKYSGILFDMLGDHIFNVFNKILDYEFGIIKNGGIFLDSPTTIRIRNFIQKLSEGKINRNLDINKILDKIEQYKKGRYELDKNYKISRIEALKQEKITRKMLDNWHISFDEYYRSVSQIRKDWITKIIKEAGLRFTDDKIEEIVVDVHKYPYCNTFSRIRWAMLYQYIVLNKKVEWGDWYDQNQLIYLTGLDLLVSNEKRLKILARDVFGNQNRVLNLDEFLELV